MAKAMIEAHGLARVYGAESDAPVRALDGVDVVVAEGEFVGVAGPSGSGKSTLLNILGCLDRPTNGTYRLAGRDVSSLSDRELSRVRAAREKNQDGNQD